MSHRKSIDAILRRQLFRDSGTGNDLVYRFAESMALIENCVAVVSDLKYSRSRIFSGEFSKMLGLSHYSQEDSIWEKEILDKMTESEREAKFLAELRFLNYLRHKPRNRRGEYYLLTSLRIESSARKSLDVLHRMYYWYEDNCETIRYGICLYGPLLFEIPAKSLVVNSITGQKEELSDMADHNMLTVRERQILAMIETGMTSQAIADEFCISRHTVSRHRQDILKKLQAKNSTEACRLAKRLKIIG